MSQRYVCKCCLGSGMLKDIWKPHMQLNKVDIYGEMLCECFALNWQEPENHKEFICPTCIKKLDQALDFRRQVLATELDLMLYANVQPTNKESVFVRSNLNKDSKKKTETAVKQYPRVQEEDQDVYIVADKGDQLYTAAERKERGKEHKEVENDAEVYFVAEETETEQPNEDIMEMAEKLKETEKELGYKIRDKRTENVTEELLEIHDENVRGDLERSTESEGLELKLVSETNTDKTAFDKPNDGKITEKTNTDEVSDSGHDENEAEYLEFDIFQQETGEPKVSPVKETANRKRKHEGLDTEIRSVTGNIESDSPLGSNSSKKFIFSPTMISKPNIIRRSTKLYSPMRSRTQFNDLFDSLTESATPTNSVTLSESPIMSTKEAISDRIPDSTSMSTSTNSKVASDELSDSSITTVTKSITKEATSDTSPESPTLICSKSKVTSDTESDPSTTLTMTEEKKVESDRPLDSPVLTRSKIKEMTSDDQSDSPITPSTKAKKVEGKVLDSFQDSAISDRLTTRNMTKSTENVNTRRRTDSPTTSKINTSDRTSDLKLTRSKSKSNPSQIASKLTRSKAKNANMQVRLRRIKVTKK